MWRRRNAAGVAMAPGALRAASVGSMAPILAATALSSYADRRTALNAPPVNSKTTSSDCVSATALLVLRGVGAGLAWTIGVDGYMLASVTDAEWRERLVARPGSTVMREVARTMVRLSARNMLGFASFLGIFGGVSCSLEKLRGKTDLLNPFMGGFIAGMAVLPAELRKPRALVSAALLCGSASMALHYFIPTSGDNKNNNNNRKER